jgi:hypothetical protein
MCHSPYNLGRVPPLIWAYVLKITSSIFIIVMEKPVN